MLKTDHLSQVRPRLPGVYYILCFFPPRHVIGRGCGWLTGSTWSSHPPAVNMLISSCFNTPVFLTTVARLFSQQSWWDLNLSQSFMWVFSCVFLALCHIHLICSKSACESSWKIILPYYFVEVYTPTSQILPTCHVLSGDQATSLTINSESCRQSVLSAPSSWVCSATGRSIKKVVYSRLNTYYYYYCFSVCNFSFSCLLFFLVVLICFLSLCALFCFTLPILVLC